MNRQIFCSPHQIIKTAFDTKKNWKSKGFPSSEKLIEHDCMENWFLFLKLNGFFDNGYAVWHEKSLLYNFIHGVYAKNVIIQLPYMKNVRLTICQYRSDTKLCAYLLHIGLEMMEKIRMIGKKNKIIHIQESFLQKKVCMQKYVLLSIT